MSPSEPRPDGSPEREPGLITEADAIAADFRSAGKASDEEAGDWHGQARNGLRGLWMPEQDDYDQEREIERASDLLISSPDAVSRLGWRGTLLRSFISLHRGNPEEAHRLREEAYSGALRTGRLDAAWDIADDAIWEPVAETERCRRRWYRFNELEMSLYRPVVLQQLDMDTRIDMQVQYKLPHRVTGRALIGLLSDHPILEGLNGLERLRAAGSLIDLPAWDGAHRTVEGLLGAVPEPEYGNPRDVQERGENPFDRRATNEDSTQLGAIRMFRNAAERFREIDTLEHLTAAEAVYYLDAIDRIQQQARNLENVSQGLQLFSEESDQAKHRELLERVEEIRELAKTGRLETYDKTHIAIAEGEPAAERCRVDYDATLVADEPTTGSIEFWVARWKPSRKESTARKRRVKRELVQRGRADSLGA